MATRAAAGGEACIEHLPVPVFATVMGFGGWTLATAALERHYGAAPGASLVLLVVTAALFLFLASLYLLKLQRHPGRVAEEWRHPVRRSFFPAISIGLLLIATATAPHRADVALPLWAVGTALQLLLTLLIVRAWIVSDHALAHLNPGWFVPAVGNIVVPLAGVPLGFAEISFFFFALGLFFWLVLVTLVFNRLIFHDPLPERLLPTLAILVAPPAVGFLAWTNLAGKPDLLAHLLFDLALFFALLVATLARRLLAVSFGLSAWAWSFPLAAFTAACLRYADHHGGGFFAGLGTGAYIVLVGVMVALTARTLMWVRAGGPCRPEG